MKPDRASNTTAQHYGARRSVADRSVPPGLDRERCASPIDLDRQDKKVRKARGQRNERMSPAPGLREFAPAGHFTLKRNGAVTRANPGGARLLNVEPARLTGRCFGTFVVQADLKIFNAFLEAVFAARADRPCEVRLAAKGAPGRTVRIEGELSADGQSCYAVVVDISARIQAEMQTRHHNRVLEMLIAKKPLVMVLDTIAGQVEEANPGMVCTIFLLDAEDTHLEHSVARSTPARDGVIVDGLFMIPGVWSCGTPAGKRVVIVDSETDHYWAPLPDHARKAGFGASWSQPILSGDGTVLGTLAVYFSHATQPSDAELKQVEDQVRLAALAIERTTAEDHLQLAARAFSHASEAIMVTDAEGTIIEVNEAFTRITGYRRDEALGQNPRMLNSGRQGPEFYAEMRLALAREGQWCGDIWNRRKNGELYAEMMTIRAVHDANGQVHSYVALFSDVTSIKEQQQQLERIAHYDSLTRLPNRLLLVDRLRHAMVQSQRHGDSVAVVYLDLDGFKAVNDEYGHHVGDEMLIALTQRMKAALREGDTLARVGGDEFVAVLVDLKQFADCTPVLDRLLQAAADPVDAGGTALQVSASIGITLYPQDGVEIDELMRHADEAMYRAKQSGRNHYQVFNGGSDRS